MPRRLRRGQDRNGSFLSVGSPLRQAGGPLFRIRPQMGVAQVVVRLGEEGLGVDDFANRQRVALVEPPKEPAAHGVRRIGSPTGVKGDLRLPEGVMLVAGISARSFVERGATGDGTCPKRRQSRDGPVQETAIARRSSSDPYQWHWQGMRQAAQASVVTPVRARGVTRAR